jgi:hypothetical protein
MVWYANVIIVTTDDPYIALLQVHYVIHHGYVATDF